MVAVCITAIIMPQVANQSSEPVINFNALDQSGVNKNKVKNGMMPKIMAVITALMFGIVS